MLQRHGLTLDYNVEKGDEYSDDRLLVKVKDNTGQEVGDVDLMHDPERKVYQITYSSLGELPRGEGIGTSVYRSIRDYVGKHFGCTVASDYTRSPFANRAWQSMQKSGIAIRKIRDLPGVPKSTHPGSGELDYYEMEGKLPEDVVTHKRRHGLVQAYKAAGCKTDSDILAMAASHGLVAQAEVEAALSEQRENSTAMIVVPGEPPGRNICAFIRKLLADRTKLIVVAQDGRLAPGNFERMLRASMPDVEKKLRVMDAGGPSLADIINMAERNRHYRPSQALEVYCRQDQVAGFQQEVHDGSLKFDPTVIRIIPTQVPKDDPDDITRAVSRDDNSAMHRVLDPHVFSDQDAIHDYKQALLHSENLQLEFLRDIASTKERGAKRLASIAQKNHELLDRRGIDIEGAEYLGSGNNGSAYKLRDGRILKLTTDDAEAHIASFIKGKQFKHVFKIYDVWAFPGTYSRDSKSAAHHVYGLVTEENLEKPDKYEQDMFDWMVETIEHFAEIANVNLEDDLKVALQTMMADQEYPPENKKEVLKSVKQFDLIGMMSDMKKIGAQADLHSGNFMRRPDGTFVIIDIGTGGSQESAKPPFIESESFLDIEVPSLDDGRLIEFGSIAPGSGVNGPMQMKGSNSSSWASGQLALQDPRNHVPEDEEETENDHSLDWGPGRASGASF